MINRSPMQGGPKSWKSNQEGHKPTNSLIIGDFYKSQNNNSPHFSPKTPKESHSVKVHTIQRHCSEDDFKRYFTQPPTFKPDSPYNATDEYYSDFGATGTAKPNKNNQIHDKSTKLQQKPSHRDKHLFEHIHIKPNALKETSSTQSHQNLKTCIRPIPNFMRNRQSDYRYLRLSSPRMHLRRQNFKIYSKLGEGKFGKVFMVKEIKTGFILAMKIVEKSKILKENLLDQFIRELKIQSFLNHSNIISLYGFFQDETHFYTLMELGCDSQLYSLIEHHKVLSEETTSFIVKNLLEAVTYMHANKILHRDIKPENIVLIMGNVKVCDFGWAVNKLHPGELRTTFCGTPLYLSPQILQGNRYDEKVDLWAIGILAYELLVGSSPFDIMDQCDLKKIITEDVKFPQKQFSEEFQNFIKAMLAKDPSERLSSNKLLMLDFITKYEGFETCEQLCK